MKLAEALDRRSERGPHRDRDVVIAAARSTQRWTLSPLDLDEFVADDRPTTISIETIEPSRRGTAWLAVAAVIAAAVIAGGGLVILRNSTTTNAPTADAPSVPTGCAQAPSSSGTASTIGSLNVIGLPTPALLPVAVPDGYCPIFASVSTGDNAPQRTTVWSSCVDCTALTASVKLVRTGDDPGTTETPERVHDDFTINNRHVRFYPAAGDEPAVQLVSRDGLQPGFSFYGWGATKTDLTELASSLIAGNDVPSSDALHLVFDGQLGAQWPGASPSDTTIRIGYTGQGGDGQLSFSYQHDTGTGPALTAFASATPNATLTTINGAPALVSSYQRATTILLRPDDHTLIGIESVRTGERPPLTVDELSTINVTPAPSTDVRWAQLSEQTAANPIPGDTVPVNGG